MLEACLRNKIINDFLKNYKKSRWQKLIPSLIEIAILNLNSSFHTVFFSEEDIHNIIEELKINQNKNGNFEEPKLKKEVREHIIFSKPSNEWRTADGGVEPIKSNTIKKTTIDNRDFFFDSSNISNNNSKYSNNNRRNNREREIEKENIINKKNIKNTKSKIKDQVEMDKKNYYNRKLENYKKSINQIEKINYAISYDKNLQPELIEKTTINKGKKGGKKIIQKMTQEEYEQQFPPEQNQEDNENENDYEEGENDDQNYEENEEEEYYEEQNNNNDNQNEEQEYYGNNLNNLNNNNIQNNKMNNNYNYNNNNIINNNSNNNQFKNNNYQNIQNLPNTNIQIKKKK